MQFQRVLKSLGQSVINWMKRRVARVLSMQCMCDLKRLYNLNENIWRFGTAQRGKSDTETMCVYLCETTLSKSQNDSCNGPKARFTQKWLSHFISQNVTKNATLSGRCGARTSNFQTIRSQERSFCHVIKKKKCLPCQVFTWKKKNNIKHHFNIRPRCTPEQVWPACSFWASWEHLSPSICCHWWAPCGESDDGHRWRSRGSVCPPSRQSPK